MPVAVTRRGCAGTDNALAMAKSCSHACLLAKKHMMRKLPVGLIEFAMMRVNNGARTFSPEEVTAFCTTGTSEPASTSELAHTPARAPPPPRRDGR